MTVIRLTEYATSDEVLSLDDALALTAASDGALQLSAPVDGGVRLVAKQHVGVVVAGALEARIEPKVPMANVIAMLAAATRLTDWHPGSTQLDTQDDLLRSVIAFFARTTSDLLTAGPQRSYVVHEELLVGPRGRIDVAEMTRRAGVPSPVACSFDELTDDTLLNRYLLAATEVSLRSGELDPVTVRLLRHVRSLLQSVTAVPLAADAIDRHNFTRLDGRYRPAIALARLILERLSLHHGDGDRTVHAFTVDMNRLFEQWVAARLSAHLPSGFRVRPQAPRHLDTAGKLAIAPDLEITHHGRTVYVADTKYKLTANGRGRIGDYYQAHAYATVLGLNEAMLIYCDDDGATPEHAIRVEGTDILIPSFHVALAGTASELERNVHRLADTIRERAAALRARPRALVHLRPSA